MKPKKLISIVVPMGKGKRWMFKQGKRVKNPKTINLSCLRDPREWLQRIKMFFLLPVVLPNLKGATVIELCHVR